MNKFTVIFLILCINCHAQEIQQININKPGTYFFKVDDHITKTYIPVDYYGRYYKKIFTSKGIFFILQFENTGRLIYFDKTTKNYIDDYPADLLYSYLRSPAIEYNFNDIVVIDDDNCSKIKRITIRNNNELNIENINEIDADIIDIYINNNYIIYQTENNSIFLIKLDTLKELYRIDIDIKDHTFIIFFIDDKGNMYFVDKKNDLYISKIKTDLQISDFEKYVIPQNEIVRFISSTGIISTLNKETQRISFFQIGNDQLSKIQSNDIFVFENTNPSKNYIMMKKIDDFLIFKSEKDDNIVYIDISDNRSVSNLNFFNKDIKFTSFLIQDGLLLLKNDEWVYVYKKTRNGFEYRTHYFNIPHNRFHVGSDKILYSEGKLYTVDGEIKEIAKFKFPENFYIVQNEVVDNLLMIYVTDSFKE